MVVCNGPKGSKIAILICADALYPECWREAAFKGANVVFHISHWPIPGERMWKITNQAGAIFNSYYVIGVNSVCTDEGYSFFGGSMAVDPMGMITYEAPRGMPCVFTGATSPMARCRPASAVPIYSGQHTIAALVLRIKRALGWT